MAYRKKKWYERFTWKEIVNSFISSAVGAAIVLVAGNVQQKPSSRDLEGSQKKTAMTITAYSAEEFNAKTALGTKIRPGLDAAVSRDRLDLLGKQVYISCDDISIGIRNVVDLTNERVENTVDILVPTTKSANEFGKCSECEVIELGRIKQ